MNDTTAITPEAIDNTAPGNVANTEQLDADSLQQDILVSFKATFIQEWAGVRQFAEDEAKQLSNMLLKIYKLKMNGETTEERAKILFAIYRNSQESYLLAIRGLSKAAVDSAVQDAFNHVRTRFNRAIGFDLL